MITNPEFINRLEILISSIGVVLGLFFGIALLTTRIKYAKANVFLALYILVFSIRTAKSLFHYYYEINQAIINLFFGLILLIGPCLWLYASVLSEKISDGKIGKKYFWHFLPFLGIIFASPFIPNNGNALSTLFYIFYFLHGVIYSFYTLYWILAKSQNQNLKIKRWLIALAISTILLFAEAPFIFFEVIPFYPGSSFLFSAVIVFLTLWAFNNLSLFEDKMEKYSNSVVGQSRVEALAQQLKKLMNEDKVYLDADLTLLKLAEQMSISSKLLSQVINQVEQTSYSQYIAGYRVEEAKRNLIIPEFANYKINAIAYESGFNSISTFNAQFKKITNQTAVEYRDSFFKN